jgi:hypothetical protein
VRHQSRRLERQRAPSPPLHRAPPLASSGSGKTERRHCTLSPAPRRRHPTATDDRRGSCARSLMLQRSMLSRCGRHAGALARSAKPKTACMRLLARSMERRSSAGPQRRTAALQATRPVKVRGWQ